MRYSPLVMLVCISLVGITALTGSRFSIYRSNKILLQTVFVNREKVYVKEFA